MAIHRFFPLEMGRNGSSWGQRSAHLLCFWDLSLQTWENKLSLPLSPRTIPSPLLDNSWITWHHRKRLPIWVRWRYSSGKLVQGIATLLEQSIKSMRFVFLSLKGINGLSLLSSRLVWGQLRLLFLPSSPVGNNNIIPMTAMTLSWGNTLHIQLRGSQLMNYS